jgi:hypothetical protein
MKLRTSLFLVLACVADASAVAAQHIDSPYRYIDTSQSAGPFVGYVLTQPGHEKLGPQSAPAFGARYDIRLSGPLLAEAQVAYIPTTRAVHDTVFQGTNRRTLGTANMRLVMVDLDFRFNLTGARTWHELAPFVLAGGGIAFDMQGATALDNSVTSDQRYKFGTTFAGILGVGSEWYMTKKIGVRADARTALWKLTTPSAFLIRNPLISATQWTQNVLLSGQLSYHF